MKYKIGQKVKIKTNAEQEKRGYGLSYNDEDMLKKLKPPYVVTIKNLKHNLSYVENDENGYNCYNMEEVKYDWGEQYIKELYIKPDPINTRFEILDI